MSTRVSSNSTKTTIISIIILDIILMTLFIFFSDTILRDFKSGNSLSTFIISSFAIVIPGTLLILIILRFVRLYRDRKKSGFSLKKNIVIYYTVATALIIVPQSIISINFIKTATDNWLNREVKESLDIGLNMAIDIYNIRTKTLESLSQSTIFNTSLINAYRDKKTTFSDLKLLNPNLSSVELLNSNGSTILFLGDPNSRIKNFNINKINELYPINEREGGEYISYQYQLNLNGRVIVVLSSILGNSFTENAQFLTKTRDSISIINPHKKTIDFGLFIYYTFFSIPLFLMAILGSFVFSDEAIKPITNIEDAIKNISKGNYSFRILSKRHNEYNALINSFNNMIKEIERSRSKLKHTEQISTWQDIATRLAHEIRNPLTPINLSAQRVLLKCRQDDEETKKYMKTIISEVTRMERLLTEFRDFARFPNLNKEKVSIIKIIEDSISLYNKNYTCVNFVLNYKEDKIINVDKNQISQVISNLLINSIHAVDEKGEIDFFIETIKKKGENYCRIAIKDDGHGISEENIKNIFKPYFTTKYDGSGLGLAIVNKIILDHKGKIWIESAENRGTTFYIELPEDNK